MQNPRTRLLSLRMTYEEYYRLRDAAEVKGARSVSEFARTILLTSGQPVEAVPPSWCQSLVALEERIEKLEQDIPELKDGLLLPKRSGANSRSRKALP